MFDKLGLSYSNNGYQICYYDNLNNKYIWFYSETQSIEISFDINMNYLQAINKQVSELGWNNEK